jgi:succinate-acetate transporter protein
MEFKLANPAPAGLLGLGITIFLIALHFAFGLPIGAVIWTMCIFYAGIFAYIIGFFEFLTGNTFGTMAFFSAGTFFLTFAFFHLFVKWGWAVMPAHGMLVTYFLLWGVAFFFMWVALFLGKKPKDLQSFFIAVFVLFFLIGIFFATGKPTGLKLFIGYEGMLTGIIGMYVAFSHLIAGMKA